MRTSYLGLAALLGGCGHTAIEHPRVTVRRAEVSRDSLRVFASAFNPNAFPVTVRQAWLDLDIDNVWVASSRGSISIRLPPRKPIFVEIVAPLERRGTTRAILSAMGRPLAHYRVRGQLDVGAPDRSFGVPIRHEGLLASHRTTLALQ